MAYPIDVGSPAVTPEASTAALYTQVIVENPANLSGLITSVDVWAVSDMTGFRVGIFYLVSGTTYRCRSSATIGNVTAGSKQTFPVSLPVQKGDFIGFYFDTGTIGTGSSGTGTRYLVAGEYIDPGDSAVYALVSTRDTKLYGQGIVKGWCSK